MASIQVPIFLCHITARGRLEFIGYVVYKGQAHLVQNGWLASLLPWGQRDPASHHAGLFYSTLKKLASSLTS